MSEEVLDESVGAEAAPEQEVQEEKIESLDDLKAIADGDEDVSLDEEDVGDDAEEGEESGDDEEGEELSADDAKSEYTPDYKVKAGGKEVEIEEIFRGAITSPEAEAAFKDLYSRANGLELVSEQRDKIKEEFTALREASVQQDTAVQTLDGYLKAKDYDSFFSALEVPDADILQYALKKAQLAEGTPEQRAAYEQQMQAKRRASLAEESYNSNQSELLSLRQEKVVQDYNLELYKPEVQEFQKSFNQARGAADGEDVLADEVATLGEYYEKVHGETKPVSQLVNEVMTKYAPFTQQASQQAANGASETKPVQSNATPRELPVIPNTGPSGRAPAQKAVTSIEDLEKLADSL